MLVILFLKTSFCRHKHRNLLTQVMQNQLQASISRFTSLLESRSLVLVPLTTMRDWFVCKLVV